MKTANPGLIEYLRSDSKLRFSSGAHPIPRRLFFLFDAFAVVAAFLLAYLLRYNFSLEPSIFVVALEQSLLALIVYLSFEVLFRSFAGISNHKTGQDILRVFISTTCSVAVLWLITLLSSKLGWQLDLLNAPRSILLIHYITVLVLWSLLRILFKAKA
jgi:FlaA1/EpsC-like NDP-sugar epimerase